MYGRDSLFVRRARVAIALATLIVAACGGSASSAPTGPRPAISSFTASPSWVTAGQSATLSWSVSGVTSLSVDGLGAVTGSSAQVTPAADTTYVLTASNEFGSTQAQTTLAVFRPPTTWFAPMPQIPNANYGAADYLDLFSASAPWGNAAARVTVFKIYAAEVDFIFDDASLRNMFADLKRRHIALAMEWGPLEPVGSCGVGIEGFNGSIGLRLAQKIRDLGGSLQYVAFDEPFEFGSVYAGPNACRWSAQQVAHDAAQHLAQIRSVFPDVVVGDIEVVPDAAAIDTWLGAYQQWFDAWQAETGRPFAFFHFDVDWASDWKFGARAGWEGCDLVGAQPAEFLLTDFTLDAGAAGRLSADFANGLTGWGIWGNAALAQLQGASLHALVASGQTLGLNSVSLASPAAPAAYTFTVHATIPSGGPGGGCVIAVFQDASYVELNRAVIPILPLPVSLGPAQTDANGVYSVPIAPLPAGSTLSAQYAGSDALWPAAAAIVLGPQPVPVIGTASLPDGSVGGAYAQTLTASGGVPPYLWVAGILPPGLSLRQDGTLRGTPTAAGSYTVSLSVVDHAASPQAADASLQLLIH